MNSVLGEELTELKFAGSPNLDSRTAHSLVIEVVFMIREISKYAGKVKPIDYTNSAAAKMAAGRRAV